MAEMTKFGAKKLKIN